MVSLVFDLSNGCGFCTFLVLGETVVNIPARHQYHVISKILALYLEFLHHDDVGLENIEHGLCLSCQPKALLGDGNLKTDLPRMSGSPSMAGSQTGCECRSLVIKH